MTQLGTATAAPQLGAQSIIVNPVPGALKVNVRTNRDPSGNGTPDYRPGDHLEFYTRVNQDAYVYLFNVDPQGRVNLLAESGLQARGNFVKANTTRVFPRKGQASTFLLSLPQGLNRVLAVASPTPLGLEQIAQVKDTQGGAVPLKVTGTQGLAQALSIVVTPVPGWTSDVAQYQVGRRTLGALPALDPAARQTQVRFEKDARLSEVYVAYADRLRAAGYQPVRAQYGEQQASGTFVSGTRQLTLDVKKSGRRFDVKLVRK
ncbi:S-layer protein [Deinococcus arcticus]|uniref:S-layer protein n=2 Tax=Deinococcus arcticus TaxID=2136176 RepID=A0A2T3WAG0_9DEIO|nr:S-layer protein [Deinococcus arcticus]